MITILRDKDEERRQSPGEKTHKKATYQGGCTGRHRRIYQP